VLNTEDPWIHPEFNSARISQQHREKEKRSHGLARWLSWLPPRSNSSSLLHGQTGSSSFYQRVPSAPIRSTSFTSLPLSFLSLPPEIVHYTLCFLDALSIAAIARVCTACHDSAVAYVTLRHEQYQKDKFIQRTSVRFDIPPGCNLWRRDRVSRERDKTSRLYSEVRSRSIHSQLNQEKNDQEKQVLLPIIVGFRSDQIHYVQQKLWVYARNQVNSVPPTPPASPLLHLTPSHLLYPLLHWNLNKSLPTNVTSHQPCVPSDFTFNVEAIYFRIIDASPGMHLYPKSISHYQHCTGVVFCASLDFLRPLADEVILEPDFLVMGPGHKRRHVNARLPPRCSRPRRTHPGESQLEQSLRMFMYLCSTRWFEDVPIVLLFTQSDLFMQLLQTHNLQTVFPTYQGGSDYACATQFLIHLFLSQNSSPYRKVYTYFIPQDSSAEETIVPILFNCVKNIVLERGLRYASILL